MGLQSSVNDSAGGIILPCLFHLFFADGMLLAGGLFCIEGLGRGGEWAYGLQFIFWRAFSCGQ